MTPFATVRLSVLKKKGFKYNGTTKCCKGLFPLKNHNNLRRVLPEFWSSINSWLTLWVPRQSCVDNSAMANDSTCNTFNTQSTSWHIFQAFTKKRLLLRKLFEIRTSDVNIKKSILSYFVTRPTFWFPIVLSY